jgi:dolichol-phosphate mannosyltransferase
MDPALSIIMCAYNEIERIEEGLNDVLRSLEGRSANVEILIFDNCSTDGTREWLSGLRHPLVRVELNERNLGKGGSIRRGLRLARGQHIVIHDPDLEYRASDVWHMLEMAYQTKASLVLGSRVLGGTARYVYLQNYLGVRFLTWLINVLYGCHITDAATALKLLEREMAQRMDLQCDGFDLDFELVAAAVRLGGKVEEVPVEYYPRTREQGKKIRALRDGLLALKTIILNAGGKIQRPRD